MTLFEYGAGTAFFVAFFVWCEWRAPREFRSILWAVQFGLLWPVTLIVFTMLYWHRWTEPRREDAETPETDVALVEDAEVEPK